MLVQPRAPLSKVPLRIIARCTTWVRSIGNDVVRVTAEVLAPVSVLACAAVAGPTARAIPRELATAIVTPRAAPARARRRGVEGWTRETAGRVRVST